MQVISIATDNEWKTRHESQAEMNEQLQKQIVLLQERQTEARTNIRESEYSWIIIFV